MTGELTQCLECPQCGWENGLLDATDGLHAIQRQCGNSRCRISFLAVYRDSELIGTQRLIGHDVLSYRRTLSLIPELDDREIEILLDKARARTEQMPFDKALA